MTDLPDGWSRTTLGSLGRYINGRGFKKSEWSSTGRPIIRIQNLTGSSEVFNRFQGDIEDRYIVRRGDLLVSWAATLGAYFWTGEEGVLNQHIFKVDSSIDVRFHRYLLDYKLAELMRHTHGSGMVHITRDRFDSVPVDLPPLNEQHRIVDILEDHLSRLDAAGAGLVQAERRLTPALDQWLRHELANEPPPGETSVIGAALVSSRGGWSRSRAHIVAPPDGVPYLKMNNITRRGHLDLDEVVRVTASPSQHAQYRISNGDVLFNSKNSGDLVGKTAVADHRVEGWVFNENIMRLRFDARLEPDFLRLWFLGPSMRREIMAAASASTNVAAVYMHALKGFRLWVPDRITQLRLVAGYRDFEDSVMGLRVTIDASSRRSAALRGALLTAAFSGRLTGRSSDLDLAEELIDA